MADHPEPTAAKPRRRVRLRLTLGLLMVLIAALAVGLAWVSNASRAQREAVVAIRRAGGTVLYDYEAVRSDFFEPGSIEPPGPKWLRAIVGDEPFRKVAIVHLNEPRRGGRPGVEALRALPDVVSLSIAGPEGLSDSDFETLQGLRSLESLELQGVKLGDAGVARLREVPRLRELHLSHAGLTDAGAPALLDLPNLETLGLAEPAITDATLATLGRSKTLKYLWLEGPKVGQPAMGALKRAGIQVYWRPMR